MSLLRLLAVTAAALVLGGWWWVANAPSPASAPSPVPSSERFTVVAPVSPLPASERGEPPPHPSEILAYDISQVDERLPVRVAVIDRESGVLTDGGLMDFSGTVTGDLRFVLEYVCLGEGEVEVEVIGPDGSTHHRQTGCDGTVEALEFSTSVVGYEVVELMAHTDRFVGVAAQLFRNEDVEEHSPAPTSPPNREEQGANTWPRSY